MSSPRTVAIIPTSHLDLFWLGDYRNCLRRGDELIRAYIDRAVESKDETFVIDTAIFAEHFLAKNPDYEGRVRSLLADGRLEIGGAYIDRWENLVLGESIIRNIQIGRAWARERLGLDTGLAAHPDLPGLNAQTSQIYSQAGIRYYVTSRKIFQEGRIWRHRAPDGTALLMLTWPQHYVFLALNDKGLDPRGVGSFLEGKVLSYDSIDERYPHGTIAVSGSAGDLTDPSDFVTRYGKDLREYVGQYRAEEPDLTIEYAVPATVMAPYLNSETALAEVTGSIPSVWGVAPDEEMRFFHRARALEALLLDAETASAIGVVSGRSALPQSARDWRGLFAEDAYFASDDTPPEGKEWEWLWRMHVFTQDHNGGGQDGPLSIFQKKVRHDRTREYALEALHHAVGRGQSEQPSLLRTRLGRSERSLIVDPHTTDELAEWFDAQPSALVQFVHQTDGARCAAIRAESDSGVGIAPLTLVAEHSALSVTQESTVVRIDTDRVAVSINKATGNVDVTDTLSGANWSGVTGRAYAVPELGNDVTLATDEGSRRESVVESVEVVDRGPIVARVRIRWSLLAVVWTTTVQVWADSERVDIETEVDWPGFENWQVRMPMASVPRRLVTHGTPFHASGWEEIPEGVHPLSRDEISADDLASYREVQHWVHVGASDGAAGLAIVTQHPAFHHDGNNLEAVLLRTAPSCGDPRMAWTNPGRTTWTFSLVPVVSDWREAELPELADVEWRRPRILPNAAQERQQLLVSTGETVRLSALFVDSDGCLQARLVNQSDATRAVRLSGAAIGDSAELVDLDGNTQRVVQPVGGVLSLDLPAWRIQTINLGVLATPPSH